MTQITEITEITAIIEITEKLKKSLSQKSQKHKEITKKSEIMCEFFHSNYPSVLILRVMVMVKKTYLILNTFLTYKYFDNLKRVKNNTINICICKF